MDYPRTKIFNELKKIQVCHNDLRNSGRDCMDKTADCIYNEGNYGLLNYMKEKKYIIMHESQYSGRIVPFLSPYGKDFLKNNSYIKCKIQDNQWLVDIIIGICVTIIAGILIYILTT